MTSKPQKPKKENATAMANLRIKPSTNEVWSAIANNLGISKVAVFEMLVHEKAAQMGLIKRRILPNHFATTSEKESLVYFDASFFADAIQSMPDPQSAEAVRKMVDAMATCFAVMHEYSHAQHDFVINDPNNENAQIVIEANGSHQSEPSTPKRGRGRPRKADAGDLSQLPKISSDEDHWDNRLPNASYTLESLASEEVVDPTPLRGRSRKAAGAGDSEVKEDAGRADAEPVGLGK